MPRRSIDYSATRFSTVLFNGLFTENEEERQNAIENIMSVVRTWAAQCAQLELELKELKESNLVLDKEPSSSSKESRSRQEQDVQPQQQQQQMVLEETQRLLRMHLLIILRMSINCPFDLVRSRFLSFLQDLSKLGVDIPRPMHDSPSFFIAAHQLVSFDSQQVSAETRHVAGRVFLANGRFSHVNRLLVYFPTYMEKFNQTYNHILRGQGPLPRSWRIYIGIMAAAQHQCQYIASLLTQEYIQHGGEMQWLDGLASAPMKLQNLATLNTVLAHQPWMLTTEHIGFLVKGNDNWSMSELVQAIVVLATVHSLCSFVLGCGLAPEIDMLGGTSDQSGDMYLPEARRDQHDNEQEAELTHQTLALIRRLKQQTTSAAGEGEEEEVAEDFSQNMAEAFEKCGAQDSVSGPAFSVEDEKPIHLVFEDLSRYLGSSELRHVDFNFKATAYSVFRLQDYSWEEHGCALVSEYLPGIGELLDEEFSATLNLTDYSLFNTRQVTNELVDTWPFRQAIWYYVLRLAGMSHDDYNYHEVNIYLNRRIKQYIKKVACYPESIVPSDFHRMGFTFRQDEKCQINLLAAEARKSAELLYGLHAVMRYMR